MHSPDSVLALDEHLYQAPAYAKLLPELILALLGHTGDVFIEKFLPGQPLGQEVSPDRCDFAVTEAPGLVSSSERSNNFSYTCLLTRQLLPSAPILHDVVEKP